VRKFFLNLSKKEQKRRFLQRLENPTKYWKFSAADASEREHWDEYMAAYQDTIRHTASDEAPWYVVPADNKWFARLVVSSVVIETLSSLELHFPQVDKARLAELNRARTVLKKNHQ
jgi:polyphosphate kinase 2 (PPK2 family)